MQDTTYPTDQTTIALHLIKGRWYASCPTCGSVLAESRDQERAEKWAAPSGARSATRDPVGRPEPDDNLGPWLGCLFSGGLLLAIVALVALFRWVL